MDNYLNYKTEDFLEDKKFVRWILFKENDDQWQGFLAEHPEIIDEVQNAKDIALSLREKQECLDKEDIQAIWKNIENYDVLLHGRDKTGFLRKAFKYAAIFVLLLSIGTFAYFYFSRLDGNYEFASGNLINRNGDAKLILSDGEEINLKKDYSSVVVTGNEEIVVNNEQSINIKESGNTITTGSKPVMNEVVVPFGKKSQLTLADGTKVWLNAGSRMAFPSVFTGTKREVYLEGEAYFEVAHNPANPFIVNVKDLSCKVLGTRFLLSAYSSDEDVVTVLLEGSVTIKDNAPLRLSRNEVVMKPGEKASLNKNDREINVKKEENTDLYIAWTEGWFEFSRENLFTVFNKLKRYYNVNFIYDKSFPSDDLISGKLDLKDSISDVMATISTLSNISYQINQNNIYINVTRK